VSRPLTQSVGTVASTWSVNDWPLGIDGVVPASGAEWPVVQPSESASM
jgi:hypothetical protein